MTAIGPGTRVKCINGAWNRGRYASPVQPLLGSKWTVLHVFRSGLILDCRWKLIMDMLAFEEIGSTQVYAAHYFVPIDDLGDLRESVREAKNPDAPARERELV